MQEDESSTEEMEALFSQLADDTLMGVQGYLRSTTLNNIVDIVAQLPSLQRRVHNKLLNAISMTLISEPYMMLDAYAEPNAQFSFSVPTGSDPRTNIALALNVLSTLDFDFPRARPPLISAGRPRAV